MQEPGPSSRGRRAASRWHFAEWLDRPPAQQSGGAALHDARSRGAARRRPWWPDVAGDLDVVEADHRQLAGHLDPDPRRLEDTDRLHPRRRRRRWAAGEGKEALRMRSHARRGASASLAQRTWIPAASSARSWHRVRSRLQWRGAGRRSRRRGGDRARRDVALRSRRLRRRRPRCSGSGVHDDTTRRGCRRPASRSTCCSAGAWRPRAPCTRIPSVEELEGATLPGLRLDVETIRSYLELLRPSTMPRTRCTADVGEAGQERRRRHRPRCRERLRARAVT